MQPADRGDRRDPLCLGNSCTAIRTQSFWSVCQGVQIQSLLGKVKLTSFKNVFVSSVSGCVTVFNMAYGATHGSRCIPVFPYTLIPLPSGFGWCSLVSTSPPECY